MREFLKELINLQSLEIELHRAEAKRNALLKKLEELEKEKSKIDKELSNKKHILEKSLNEVQELKDFILRKKKEKNLLTKLKEDARNREEFKNFLREIAKVEDEIIKSGEKLIEFETETDDLKAEFNEIVQLKKTEKERINKLKEEICENLEYVQKEIENLKNKIGKIRKEIPENILKEYYNLREKFKGMVFSDISSGSCEACRITFSSAEFSKLTSRLEIGKSRCPYCGRFIYKKGEIPPF